MLLSRSSRHSFGVQGNAPQKSFFQYAHLSAHGGDDDEDSQKRMKRLTGECEKLSRQCDELKVNDGSWTDYGTSVLLAVTGTGSPESDQPGES